MREEEKRGEGVREKVRRGVRGAEGVKGEAEEERREYLLFVVRLFLQIAYFIFVEIVKFRLQLITLNVAHIHLYRQTRGQEN